MSDNPFDSLLNKSVPDKPGKPLPPPPVRPEPPAEGGGPSPEDDGPPPADDPRPEDDHTPPARPPASEAPPPVASLDDLRSPVIEFEQVAGDMRRYAEGLKSALASAADRTHEVASDDGSFTVTVDGRPRVRRIRIDPRAMRRSPEELTAKVIAVVNEAVRVSRQEGYEELMGELDPESRSMLRDGSTDARRIASEEES